MNGNDMINEFADGQAQQEQSERYELLADAIRECALRGVSDKALETLCLESGFSSKHLAQTMGEVGHKRTINQLIQN